VLALVLKCALGAAAVLVIALLSRSRYFVIAGLVPLFPTFALIAHVLVGADQGPLALRATALFGLFSLAPYAVYLGAVYGLSTRLSLPACLAAATLAWIAAAVLLILLWSRVHPEAL
jgi:membrane protein GlpM